MSVDCEYEKLDGCSVESPRWLSRVFRAVGLLIGDGEIDLGKGDLGAP